VNASSADVIEDFRVRSWKLGEGRDTGAAGHVPHWHTNQSVKSKYIVRYGLHAVVMGSPIVSIAAMDIFEA
jgi:hypothetical protein